MRTSSAVGALVSALALAAGACSTGAATNPCESVGCSGHGFCIVDQLSPYCICQPDYHPESLACIANDGCLGVACTGHGTCTVGPAGPECACAPGYTHPLDYALHCVPDPDWDGAEPADDAGPDDAGGCEIGALEQCNGLDDDCDGLVDETFDFDFESANCGACRHACTGGPHGSPTCVLGECALVCEAGWADLDGVPATGCEAGCTPAGTPDETLCEGLDDDCDGLTDEDWVAASSCGLGACQRPATCFRGSFTCRPRPPPAADDPTCDGLDDDCDGTVDEEAAGCAADADADAPDIGDATDAEAEATLCGNGTLDPGEECEAPASDDCGDCGSRDCSATTCTWGACNDPGETCSRCGSGQCYNRLTRQDSGCGCDSGCFANCGRAGTSYDVACPAAGDTCTFHVESSGYEFDCHC